MKWRTQQMRKVALVAVIIITVSTTFSTNAAEAIFGLSKCDKSKVRINKLETTVNQKLRSLKNVGNLVDKTSPLVTSVYANGDILETALLQIRQIGLDNPKCYNLRQFARLRVSEYWSKEYYVEIYPLIDTVMVNMRYQYLNLYGNTLK
jgi:hypothetical protein